MIVFVNDKSEIHDVGSTNDPTLIPLEITDEGNPFAGWSVAKICCYKCAVSNGIVTMFTPYVDSKLIQHIDQLGKQVEAATPWTQKKTAYIDDAEIVFDNVPNGAYNVSFNKSVLATRVLKEDFSDGTSTITVDFEPLEEVTEVTLTIH